VRQPEVSKFFPNIDHRILFEKLCGELTDWRVLDLIAKILRSYRSGPKIQVRLFPGDDLVEATARARGLPIGNFTSQLWANFFLDDLDHWVTEIERHGAYLRYTDDFLLFGNDKQRLWELQAGIRERLMSIRLALAEPKSRLLATREGVPFCGFRFLPGLRPLPDNLLASYRNNNTPDNRNDNIGFRCVVAVESSRKATMRIGEMRDGASCSARAKMPA
jgi:Reverse transcriptase (RNA-dependent DNA polymerase)